MILTPGELIAGRYEIIEKIGAGGMSIVYRAEDTKLDRFVSFKVLREEHMADEGFKAQMKDEARAVARLNSPNIVNVFDAGQDGEIHYIVMEYIDGVTLKDLIIKKAPFDNVETLGIAIQIASALLHAHQNNIIHRDIKPQNVLVTEKGIVKVTDFGIARTTSASTMSYGDVTMGSVHYLSPEQARGGYVDEKSDLYSLGISMFEMATGTLPFDGEKSVAIALKHINDKLPDMRAINPHISPSVESIILKLTQKNTINRYSCAEELLYDAKQALKNPESAVIIKKDEEAVSPTIKINEDDLSSIRKKTSAKLPYEESFEEEKPRKKPTVNDLYDEFPDDEFPDDEYDEEYDEDTGRSDWKIILGGIITAFAIIFAIIMIALPKIKPLLQMSTDSPTEETMSIVIVPKLIGKTIEEAENECKELGIYLEELKPQKSDIFEENIIMDQSYNAGENIPAGATISVVVSLGTSKVEIPDFTNDTIDNAYANADNYPITLNPVYESNEDILSGLVIRQDPIAGTQIDKVTTVTLYVSQGKEQKKVVMPKLKDMTEEEALLMLEELGLEVSTIQRQESTIFAEGIVMTQSIAERKEVFTGETKVALVVSAGMPEPIETPTPTTSPTEAPTEAPSEAVGDEYTEKPNNPIDTTEENEENPSETNSNNTEPPDIDVIEETKEPEPTEKQPVSAILVFPAIFDASFDGVDAVVVKVQKPWGDWRKVVYEEEHKKTEFPIEIPVSDVGTITYQLYINDVFYDSHTMKFTDD